MPAAGPIAGHGLLGITDRECHLCFGIGYCRAARRIDFMAEDGIVGQYAGSQAREVIISVEEWEAMQAGTAAEESKGKSGPFGASSAPPKKRNNKIVPEREELDEPEEDEVPFEADEEEEDVTGSADDESEGDEKEDAFSESDYEAESA